MVKRETKNMEAFNNLHDNFSVNDVKEALVSNPKIESYLCGRWKKEGFYL